MLTEGVTKTTSFKTAFPVIVVVHCVNAFVATTVYVPPTLCTPKEIAAPVPATGAPIFVVPLYTN